MKEFKGTPGSWVVDEDYDVTTEDGTVVSWGAEGIFEPDEIIANAHLIAAAPDLLEALQQMVERIEYYASLKETGQPNIEDWAYTYNSGDMDDARAAISKALGEE